MTNSAVPVQQRQMRELALEHASGSLSDENYLERMKRMRASVAEVEETRQVGVAADRAVEWLRALSETWEQADVPQARSELPPRNLRAHRHRRDGIRVSPSYP